MRVYSSWVVTSEDLNIYINEILKNLMETLGEADLQRFQGAKDYKWQTTWHSPKASKGTVKC